MSKQIEFANFICRFGEKKVLMDLAEEIVLPAFLSDNIRAYGDTRYFFYQTQLIELQKGTTPILGIAGRFVKDTILEREQVFEEKVGLKRDHQAIRSAPSTIFVLILNNHKLIYLHETANAPNLNAFKATAEKFMMEKYRAYLNKTYDERKLLEENITKKDMMKDLTEEYPRPTVEIVPLSSESSFEEFIKQYYILRNLQIRLLQTNNELDMNEFFLQVRDQMDVIGSRQTTLIHNNPEGLSKDEVIKKLSPVAGQGNAQISLEGKDAQGDILKGNNDNFKIKVPIGQVEENVSGAALQLYDIFRKLVKRGTLSVSKKYEASVEKIQALRKHTKKS